MRFVAVEIGFRVGDGARGGRRTAEKLTVLAEDVEEGLSSTLRCTVAVRVVGVAVVAGSAVTVGLPAHAVACVVRSVDGHTRSVDFEKNVASTVTAAFLWVEIGIGERCVETRQTKTGSDIWGELRERSAKTLGEGFGRRQAEIGTRCLSAATLTDIRRMALMRWWSST